MQSRSVEYLNNMELEWAKYIPSSYPSSMVSIIQPAAGCTCKCIASKLSPCKQNWPLWSCPSHTGSVLKQFCLYSAFVWEYLEPVCCLGIKGSLTLKKLRHKEKCSFAAHSSKSRSFKNWTETDLEKMWGSVLCIKYRKYSSLWHRAQTFRRHHHGNISYPGYRKD